MTRWLTLGRTLLRLPRQHRLIAAGAPAGGRQQLRSTARQLPRGWGIVTIAGTDGAPVRDLTLLFESAAGERPLRLPLHQLGEARFRRLLRLPARPAAVIAQGEAVEAGTLPSITVRELTALELVLRAVGRRRNPLGRSFGYLRTRGMRAAWRKLLHALDPADEADYGRWIAAFDTLAPEDRAAIAAEVAAMADPPLISILTPVYATEPAILEATVRSVGQQLYPHWQLCLVDDASPDPALRRLAERLAAEEPRIRLHVRDRNGGVAAASNDALAMAGGAFVALLDHDDLLAPHALYMVAETVARHPDAVLIYSDEDKTDGRERRDPHFKPDWDPTLLEGQNYVNHLTVLRTDAARAAGGFRVGFEGSQDYDLVLRASARCRRDQIHHIPHILYHWRIALDAETMSSLGAASAAAAATRSLEEHFERTGVRALIRPAAGGRFRRVVPMLPDPPPPVTLVVPTRDRVGLLRQCLSGLLERTDYPALSVVVVDNDSREPETLAYLRSLEADPRVTVLSRPGPFNYSRLNNDAVAATTGTLLGFINNDIDVIHADWLAEMVAQASRPGVGAVGAKLYYGDDTIQHGGVVLGIGGIGGHAFKGYDRGEPGYFSRLLLAREASAVTAACMIVPRAVLAEVGGFDEAALAVAFNDVDLCLRIRRAGYRIAWTPYAELYHLESASRGDDFTRDRAARFEREQAVMRERWAAILDADPYYNPNLTLGSEQYGLAFPPRACQPWRPD